MHVLLTGATGYVGKHVLARLLRDGHRVTVLVRPHGGHLHARVVDALRPLDRLSHDVHDLPRIDVLASDITRPDCGL
ncbi:MAG: SDR family oxidoreductase, partial [Gammaproteobacteria bacterium]